MTKRKTTTGASKPATTPTSRAPSTPMYNALMDRLLEPSTWAGCLTIGSVLATGGLATWLNASTLPILLSGVGLILAKDGHHATSATKED